VMARFANSRITAKDLDEYRRAGAKPEDFGWDPEHRWINRPTVEKIMLRTLGLPADLGEYLPRFNDHKKRWEEEELAIAQVALSSGVPSWFKTGSHHSQYSYVEHMSRLIELWKVAGDEITERDGWSVISAILKIAHTYEVSIERAWKGWKVAGPALLHLEKQRSYGGPIEGMKGDAFEETCPKVVYVTKPQTDLLRWFGPDRSFADLGSVIDYSAQVAALVSWWSRFGDHGIYVEQLFYLWAARVIPNVRKEQGMDARNQVYPTVEQKMIVAKRIAAKVTLGIEPKVYDVMRSLDIPEAEMLNTLRASEELDRLAEVGVAELDLSEAEADEGTTTHVVSPDEYDWDDGADEDGLMQDREEG
jgi:hypothetical protein